MDRTAGWQRVLERDEPWDMLIAGGGATGLGIAVDAAARGYEVLLVERSDFAKGTSSRSTKLIHGGVRYLEQGNISLVMEALEERSVLRKNAPHLVRDLPFVVPSYRWWESPFYGIGLKLYDLMAGRHGFGRSVHLSREEVLEAIPTVEDDGLRGGTRYHDGQFDDARLAINLAQTAWERGAVVLNYVELAGFTRDAEGQLDGARLRDLEGGREPTVSARVVINATGPFADGLRRLDDPAVEPLIAPSQGVHLVLERSFLPGDAAIMVPHTDDGRVLFAIPWHDRVVVGTTDSAVDETPEEPLPTDEEIDFILRNAGRYLEHPPTRADVKSAFAGLRPLVRSGQGGDTATLSRDHTVHVAQSGLITVAGGKWTTYRHMAEDAVGHAALLADLEPRPCTTRELPIHGSHPDADSFGRLAFYGADAPAVRALLDSDPALDERLHPAFASRCGQVLWACRHEMARTVDDYLARRTRALLFDARAAAEAAPRVAELMATELGRDGAWCADQVASFRALARAYRVDA